MYLVYQVPLSGVGVVEHLVSYDTLHLLEHILQEEEGCESGISDAGPVKWGGGTRSDWLGMTRAPYTSRAARAVL